MGLGQIFSPSHRDEEGLLMKQKLNGYTILIIVTLGLGSLTYGYTASIIGTTLGQSKHGSIRYLRTLANVQH